MHGSPNFHPKILTYSIFSETTALIQSIFEHLETICKQVETHVLNNCKEKQKLNFDYLHSSKYHQRSSRVPENWVVTSKPLNKNSL